jgi:hypothetical protein
MAKTLFSEILELKALSFQLSSLGDFLAGDAAGEHRAISDPPSG